MRWVGKGVCVRNQVLADPASDWLLVVQHVIKLVQWWRQPDWHFCCLGKGFSWPCASRLDALIMP